MKSNRVKHSPQSPQTGLFRHCIASSLFLVRFWWFVLIRGSKRQPRAGCSYARRMQFCYAVFDCVFHHDAQLVVYSISIDIYRVSCRFLAKRILLEVVALSNTDTLILSPVPPSDKRLVTPTKKVCILEPHPRCVSSKRPT